jgi:hypothetical protein
MAISTRRYPEKHAGRATLGWPTCASDVAPAWQRRAKAPKIQPGGKPMIDKTTRGSRRALGTENGRLAADQPK